MVVVELIVGDLITVAEFPKARIVAEETKVEAGDKEQVTGEVEAEVEALKDSFASEVEVVTPSSFGVEI